MPYYAPNIRLAMLDLAKRRAASLGRNAAFRLGDTEQLEIADKSFGYRRVHVLPVYHPKDGQAVSEMWRVLRAGGTLLLAEHVRSPIGVVRTCQRVLEPLAVRFAADHLLRNPLEHVLAQGFVVEALVRRKLGLIELLAASKPADSG